ncbi:MAG: endonuclease/exonuclease/phosphatase family protein [Candidatus Lokiarchaeota archaeon]|nr:endonuclease/exonuclease/phosphatase family protein [Candidatus Lokiarchaeota archaeon]
MESINNFIKKFNSDIALLTVMFLFFFQLLGDLIESVYILDLLNLSLDEKAAGLLFLFTPIILLGFRRNIPDYLLEVVAIIAIILRLISPLLDSASKIITSGLGVGCIMLFLPLYYFQSIKIQNIDDGEKTSLKLGIGLASAILLSITLRALNSTVDISIYGFFQIIGWVLGIIAILLIINRLRERQTKELLGSSNEGKPNSQGEVESKKSSQFKGVKLLSLGLMSILTLTYFAFISPTVISRWTEGDYIAITIAVTIMIALTIIVLSFKPEILGKLNSKILWIWNALFVISLVLTIAVHTFPFPANPTSDPVVINRPLGMQYYIPLVIMITLLPIVFIDFTLLSRELVRQHPKPSKIGAGFVVGSLFFILVMFMLVFTNVWGYIDPVSQYFRNLFWLPFLLIGIAIPIMGKAIFKKRLLEFKSIFTNSRDKRIIASFLALLLIGTSVSVLTWELRSKAQDTSGITSLTVMTYNIQQGVNVDGDKNYDNQLAIIEEIDPDIIGLQECDTARMTHGSSDVVRYFANRLNYYSFYGPRTVTGTYGAAVLSRFPIINAKTFFTYSNEDEIGTTEVQIRVGTTIFNVYVNHPAGSDDAHLAHMQVLMNRISGKTNVISMGDFNTEPNTIYYNMSVAVLQDTWVNATSRGVDGPIFDLAERIDHIFVSTTFTVEETRYINYPESDHPAVWTEIQF